MPNATTHIKSIPLDQLFQRLELAGFVVSPADRLRAIQVLSGSGKAYIMEPEELCNLLAPVLVRSDEQQLKFYEIFAQYYREISTLPEEDEKEDVSSWPWWVRMLLVIPLLATLIGGYYQMWQETPIPEELAVLIDGPRSGVEGDTVKFYNQSSYTVDSSTLKWKWSFYDLANQETWQTDSVNFHFPVIIPQLEEGSFLREVRLEVYSPDTDSVYQTRHPFKIVCSDAPEVGGIRLRENRLDINKNLNFSTLLAPETVQAGGQQKLSGESANWYYEWDYGDGETLEGSFFAVHQYKRNGQYQVKLTVTDTSTQAFCQVEHTLSIKIGQDQVYLPAATLYADSSQVLAVWSWGYYLLLGALGLGLIYYWLRWLVSRRNEDPKRKADRKNKALFARFAHNDKGPYFIPFRDQNKAIMASSGQMRLADAMRLRQDGLRKEINVSKTLKATIDKGGFPEVRFRYASQASEYLILVDEQNRASHMGSLFKYLAESLKGQDVNVDIYYYRKHFTRFWNRYYPQGRDLDQLQRNYGHYRLLVLGDLHEMINPYASGQPKLRSAQANVVRQWSQRLLLTPAPPISWTYREKLLSRVFNVFPTDVEGLESVAMHIENDEELLPDGAAFDRWKELQIDLREDADTEYRKWKRWPAIREYLSACHPDLERWFRALAVFPLPTWSVTIAIGQALGIRITYDKLFQLARIPTLQGERFDERLRQELLSILPATDEKLAREALQEELAAVKSLSAGSHAMHELETTLAIQTFALEPLAEGSREAIRFLLREDLLSRAQEAELDRVATDNAQPVQKQAPLRNKAPVKKAIRPKVSVRKWLAEDDEVIAPPEPPQDADKRKKHLQKAILYTLAYLLLLVVGWNLGGTDGLYSAIFRQNPDERLISPERPLRDYVFIKEAEVVDSAIVYNNLGVENVLSGDTLGVFYFDAALNAANRLIHGNSDQFNGEPISYALANANKAKVFYNSAISYFNNFQEDSLGQAILPDALRLLDQAYISDTIALDVLHARGVIHYYLGSSQDSVFNNLSLLDSLGYFDRINYAPNLSTLSGLSRSEITNITANHIGDQVLNVTVDFYLNGAVDEQAELLIEALGDGVQPDEQIQIVNAGPSSYTFRLEPPSKAGAIRLTDLKIQMRRIRDRSVIDTKLEPFVHPWSIRTTRTESTNNQSENTPSTTLNLNFQLRGRVSDATTRKLIAGAFIELEELPGRTTGKLLSFSTRTDEYGDYSFNDSLNNTTNTSNFEIRVFQEGFQTHKETYTAQELLSFGQKNSAFLEILMRREIAYPKMQRIGGGNFSMGTNDETYAEDARPAHPVSLSAYSISAFEVTFTQYDHFCNATTREKPDDEGWGRGNRPVINVSWYDAIAFCNWLSEQAGYEPYYLIVMGKGQVQSVSYNGSANGYRLPTEAEWENAALGGDLKNSSQIYAGSDDINSIAWYDGNSYNQTHPVGQKKPNNAGTYDMSGNVWEWCTDIFSEYPSSSQTNPTGGTYGSHRMIRGGAWIQSREDCRVKVRQTRKPEEKEVIIGFRVARSG